MRNIVHLRYIAGDVCLSFDTKLRDPAMYYNFAEINLIF